MQSTRFLSVGVVVLALAAVGLTGCGTSGQDFSAGFREKISGPEFQKQTFGGTQEQAFEATQKILYDMGFRLTRTRAATGIVEAISSISSDSAHVGSLQRAAYVRLDEVVGGVLVEVRFTEIIEDSFGRGSPGATENTLRDTPLYQVFFRQLGNVLGDPTTAPTGS